MNNGMKDFFDRAQAHIRYAGYEPEVEYCRQLRLENFTDWGFMLAYAFVVISSGMKNQVAEKIYERFVDTMDPKVVGHPGKRLAIAQSLIEYARWFRELKASDDKVAYLETLPWIGPITKYHLARNIGLDVVKPDRHLTRIASRYGYANPDVMCHEIVSEVGERVGVVDVILWRYANLTGSRYMEGGKL